MTGASPTTIPPSWLPCPSVGIERFVGSLRRENLDHVLLLREQTLEDVARQYVLYFNKARPHQGIGQRIPGAPANDNQDGKIVAIPVLGGPHYDYRRAA
jgi:putative transposase